MTRDFTALQPKRSSFWTISVTLAYSGDSLSSFLSVLRLGLAFMSPAATAAAAVAALFSNITD